MRVILFTDLENFKQSIWKIDPKRQPNFRRFHFCFYNNIINRLKWQKYNPRFIRSYVYTGEYADSTFSKMKYYLRLAQEKKDIEQAKKIQDIINKHTPKGKAQEKLFKYIIFNCPFTDLRTTPLIYTTKAGIFQKGVDVKLATDLITHAYKDNFDVALLCSGDIDLLEAVRITKDCGKKVILISHPKLVAVNMRKGVDYFYDISKMDSKNLDIISNRLDNL